MYMARQVKTVKVNGELIDIDDNIADDIVMLNEKGYTTIACCGGHSDREVYMMSIVFDKIYAFELPKGFKLDKHRNIWFNYPQSTKKREDKYNRQVEIFKQWVKDLPKIN